MLTITFIPCASVRTSPLTHWAGEGKDLTAYQGFPVNALGKEGKGLTAFAGRWLLLVTLYEWNFLFLPPNITCFDFSQKSSNALTEYHGACLLWPLIDTDLVWNTDPILSRSIYSGNVRARRSEWDTVIEKCSSAFPNRSSNNGKLYILVVLSL